MLKHADTAVTPDRVVILGAGGFIGKKLIESLEKNNINYLAITRNEMDLASDDAVFALQKILKTSDTMVILAAITPDRDKGTSAFIKNCEIGNVIQEALKTNPVSHAVYFSSDAVYSLNNSLVDEDTPANPDDLYGLMHRARELMMQATGIPLAILRPTIIFGDGDTHNSYGPNRFIREALKKNTITLFGNGEEKRSHVFIDDVIASVIQVILRGSIGIVNLCTNSSISFMEIAKVIQTKIQKKTNIIATERRNEITHRHFNLVGFLADFPCVPITPLDVAIEKWIEKTENYAAN